MTSNNTKRIVKNTSMLYIRMFIMTLISLYTSRIILKALGIEDFGIYNVVGGIVVMFSFLNSAMALSVNRFFAYELGRKNYVQLKRLFSLSVNVHILIAIVVLIISETIGLWFLNTQLNIPLIRMKSANWVYQFSILSFIISIIKVPYNASIIAHEDMSIYAYASIIEAVLKLLIVYLLWLVFFDKLILYALLIFGVTFLMAGFYYLYSVRKYKECTYQFYYDTILFKSLLNYAGLSTFGNMAWVIVNQGQNFLLNIFFGPVTNAARGISFQISSAVNGFISNIYTAINPQIVKAYAANDREYMLKLVYQSTKFSFFFLLMITLPLVLELEFILKLWLETVPPNTLIYGRLILINSLVFNLATPSIIALQATGRIAVVHLITGSINLSNLLIAYIFLKLGYASEIVFYIQIFISIAMTISILFIQKSQLNILFKIYFKEVILPILIVTMTSVIIPIIIWDHLNNDIIRFLIVIIISFSSVLISSFYFGMNKVMRAQIIRAISNKFT